MPYRHKWPRVGVVRAAMGGGTGLRFDSQTVQCVHFCVKSHGSPALLHQADHSGLLCARRNDTFLRRHTFWHARWDTTIVMAAYNNSDILMVPYEDLPDGDKDVISKAIEEF